MNVGQCAALMDLTALRVPMHAVKESLTIALEERRLYALSYRGRCRVRAIPRFFEVGSKSVGAANCRAHREQGEGNFGRDSDAAQHGPLNRGQQRLPFSSLACTVGCDASWLHFSIASSLFLLPGTATWSLLLLRSHLSLAVSRQAFSSRPHWLPFDLETFSRTKSKFNCRRRPAAAGNLAGRAIPSDKSDDHLIISFPRRPSLSQVAFDWSHIIRSNF